MTLNNVNFMSENLTSNNIENDELTLNTQESDYKNLVKATPSSICAFTIFLISVLFFKDFKA